MSATAVDGVTAQTKEYLKIPVIRSTATSPQMPEILLVVPRTLVRDDAVSMTALPGDDLQITARYGNSGGAY